MGLIPSYTFGLFPQNTRFINLFRKLRPLYLGDSNSAIFKCLILLGEPVPVDCSNLRVQVIGYIHDYCRTHSNVDHWSWHLAIHGRYWSIVPIWWLPVRFHRPIVIVGLMDPI